MVRIRPKLSFKNQPDQCHVCESLIIVSGNVEIASEQIQGRLVQLKHSIESDKIFNKIWIFGGKFKYILTRRTCLSEFLSSGWTVALKSESTLNLDTCNYWFFLNFETRSPVIIQHCVTDLSGNVETYSNRGLKYRFLPTRHSTYHGSVQFLNPHTRIVWSEWRPSTEHLDNLKVDLWSFPWSPNQPTSSKTFLHSSIISAETIDLWSLSLSRGFVMLSNS